jgi:hypothetical protein
MAKKKKADDACTRKVKARYDVWPSAYASGALTQCRKVGAANWGNSDKSKKKAKAARGGYVARRGEFSKGGLAEWFSKNDGKGWVDCKTGKACGRKSSSDSDRPYPACRPTMADCKKQKPKTKKDSSERVDWEKKKK